MAVIVRGESCGYTSRRTGVRRKPPPAPTSVPTPPTATPSRTRSDAVSRLMPEARYRLRRSLYLVLEPNEIRRPRRFEIRDDRRLVLGAGKQRLPGGEVLQPVKVAARNRRVPRARDPGKERVPVEQLVPVDELGQLRLRAEGGRGARRADELLRRIRVGGDERRPVRARLDERGSEPGRDVDVRAQPDRDGMSRAEWVRVVVRELEAGDHEKVVQLPRPERLRPDLAQVRVVGAGGDLARLARGVVGDREDVEAVSAVEITELPQAE